MGLEPTASLVLSQSGLPIAYRAMLIERSGAPGNRTPIFCVQNRCLPVGRAPHLKLEVRRVKCQRGSRSVFNLCTSPFKLLKCPGHESNRQTLGPSIQGILGRVALPVGVTGRPMLTDRCKFLAPPGKLFYSDHFNRGWLSPVALR